MVLLPACSTVSVDKQTSAQTIAAQRSNIVTSNELSSDTSSALLSAGLNKQACMQNFDLCLTRMTDSILNQHYRPALATFAELHYAKARELASSTDCQESLARPPIDPYYANAPLSEDEAKAQQQNISLCLTNYQERLYDAIKSSYAYLFYDSLEHDFQGADQTDSNLQKQNHIPNDTDIQAQDIYNSASNDVITQIYKSTDDAAGLLGEASIDYAPIASNEKGKREQTRIANPPPLKRKLTDQIQVMSLTVNDYRIGVHLPNESSYLQNAYEQSSALADLVSTREIQLSGLNSISKRPGLGVSLVASLDDRYTTTIRQLLSSSFSDDTDEKQASANSSSGDSTPVSRIYPTGHLLLTGMVKPSGDSILEVLSTHELDINLYNPYQTANVKILNNEYPLAANFSAGYGLWLSENQLDSVGYLNLITRQPDARLPKLFMLEPYDPDKRVVIMLHGLASSPATWVNLTNDILNDDKLRDNYQVWQIFYPTNLPILENRYQIQRLINSTYAQTDPQRNHRASNESVIIGHSMGAIIARMMISDDNLVDDLDNINDQGVLSSRETREMRAAIEKSFGENELKARFELNALPQVDTAVFLSAPFRGTDYADRWFTRALRRIVYLPVGLVKTVTDNLATMATQGDLAENPLGALYLQNGASQLSDKSSFIQLTKDIAINDRITYHSIIANNDADITRGLAQMQPDNARIDLSQAIEENTKRDMPGTDDMVDINGTTDDSTEMPSQQFVAAVTVDENTNQALTERLSDGIVPYTSAHLDGAASETVINGGHSIQENPQTILTLRRILHQHINQ
ncbi:esterase/lipase family protein [Psychrobacter sp.]|uniref:esterase/lipase family protein n=1 Tax=Psychrobacter sp. TaxID=56811 RepID=UPI003F996E31